MHVITDVCHAKYRRFLLANIFAAISVMRNLWLIFMRSRFGVAFFLTSEAVISGLGCLCIHPRKSDSKSFSMVNHLANYRACLSRSPLVSESRECPLISSFTVIYGALFVIDNCTIFFKRVGGLVMLKRKKGKMVPAQSAEF